MSATGLGREAERTGCEHPGELIRSPVLDRENALLGKHKRGESRQPAPHGAKTGRSVKRQPGRRSHVSQGWRWGRGVRGGGTGGGLKGVGGE